MMRASVTRLTLWHISQSHSYTSISAWSPDTHVRLRAVATLSPHASPACSPVRQTPPGWERNPATPRMTLSCAPEHDSFVFYLQLSSSSTQFFLYLDPMKSIPVYSTIRYILSYVGKDWNSLLECTIRRLSCCHNN